MPSVDWVLILQKTQLSVLESVFGDWKKFWSSMTERMVRKKFLENTQTLKYCRSTESAFSVEACRTIKFIRDGSFSAKSKLPLQKWLMALSWWAREYPLTDLADEAEISEGAVCGIYPRIGEVCSTTLLQTPIVIVVQADDSHFRHRPKRLVLHNLAIMRIINNYCLFLAVPRKGIQSGYLGVWTSGHFTYSCTWVCTGGT